MILAIATHISVKNKNIVTTTPERATDVKKFSNVVGSIVKKLNRAFIFFLQF